MTENTPTPDLLELRQAAVAMIAADRRMDEIDEGIGGLAIHEPDMAHDLHSWINISGVDHADTVLMLLDRIDALAAILAEAREAGQDRSTGIFALGVVLRILSKPPADALAARDATTATSALREAALDVDGFERCLDEVGDAPLAMQRWLFDRIEREAQ